MSKSQIQKIEIDKNIPLPARGRNGYGATDHLRKMEIGDSFEMPKNWNVPSVRSCARAIRMKIAIRRMPNGDTRIWRIS